MSAFDDNRLFSSDPTQRKIAQELYYQIKDLPIISPHGHTDPAWFDRNENFPDPTKLLLVPDHYVLRMLYSQGISMESLGVKSIDGTPHETDSRKIWRVFAEHFYLFRGTPSAMWLNIVFKEVFGIEEKLSEKTADSFYDRIQSQLETNEFKPRALFERFNIEVISTTESPLDELIHHRNIADSGWKGRIISAFRPDPVVDPDFEGFADNIDKLAALSKQNCDSYQGYLNALRDRRAFFKSTGVTASDHGHSTALTADLSKDNCEALFQKARSGKCSAKEAELFRGQMLTEMAGMSLDDGLVMQIHPGSFRNHNPELFKRFGRDKGADIPSQTEYVQALRPLLNKYGNNPDLSIILFTLDETVYSRELAPLAGHYPCLKLGPAWWFHDSPEGMMRFREMTTETAGFYNTVGFNDDTRAFLSIPARHDVARRIDCNYLARLVAEHRLDMEDAHEVAKDLAYNLAKKAYNL
uniref:glucuronate isomerase n=1 Tax=Ningiella ruwaisensis TaxID=2364274 RepID=UPI00109FB0C6|nr:glucuronate isomerase [Ningiella ruwaisensis]